MHNNLLTAKINMYRVKYLCVIWVVFLCCCQTKDYKSAINYPQLYRLTVKKLNDIVLENNFPPVIASRNYAYANIAAYEVIAAQNPELYKSLAGQIKHLPPSPVPDKTLEIDFPFAALLSFCVVGNAVTFPEGSMDVYVDELKQQVKEAGMPSDVFKTSVDYSNTVAKHILNWSKTDNYALTRSASKYTVTQQEGRWISTPPMYAQALEPHWYEIRPLVLDSAAQITVKPPPVFNVKNKQSVFFKSAIEVQNIVTHLTLDQKHIADFWDDNAFKMNVVGHASFVTKKFSPAGHWMNIVGIATQKNNANFASTVAAYTQTSIAIFDAFLSCWYTKYKYNYVRPETVINKYIDAEWRTYIQTPPFPEYSSGHAVISAAAAEILTNNFGDNIMYRDSSENEFGIAPRNFASFRQAAEEAAISRVYGGIHFKNSCVVGTLQGVEVGKLALKKLTLKIK